MPPYLQIYHEALSRGTYTCFLSESTSLPMVYMPDLLAGTIRLMKAPEESLRQRTYNIGSLSFTPTDVAASIQKQIPHFTIDYSPDFRQKIAESWPKQLDDSAARRDWGWDPQFDLDRMTLDMLNSLDPVPKEASSDLAEKIKAAAAQREKMMTFLAEKDTEVKV